MSIRLTDHKINEHGNGVVCVAGPKAPCRTMPDCDTLTFNPSTGCADHDPRHPSTPGHECWASVWINAPIDLELWECADDWATGDLPIIPDRDIILTARGDEGVTWSYVDPPNHLT